MARKPVRKELKNSRLASTYGGWIYCNHCGENIAYLSYATYDNFKFEYACPCGENGSIHIAFGDIKNYHISISELFEIKHRLCCPNDQSPLLTILEKKLVSCRCEIDCLSCGTRYIKEKKDERVHSALTDWYHRRNN